MWIAYFPNHVVLHIADERRQLLSLDGGNLNRKQRIDDYVERELVHQRVYIDDAGRNSRQEIVDRALDRCVKSMNFLAVKAGLNESSLFQPVVAVSRKQSLAQKLTQI